MVHAKAENQRFSPLDDPLGPAGVSAISWVQQFLLEYASYSASKLMSYEEQKQMSQTRTTVALPADLLRGIDAVVRSGRSATRNEFFTTAVRRELERIRREAVDREFDAMADDPIYQREASEISEEYRIADWQALRVAEDDS